MAERAALKAGDPISFQFFSSTLDDCLRERPDNRYALRQHGYRAMVLTQLGETSTAEKHWASGDRLLEIVDKGFPSVERVQFLMFRSLASMLLGKPDEASLYCKRGKEELREVAFIDVHSAELDICCELVTIGDPKWRSTHLQKANIQINQALSNFHLMLESVTEEAVRSKYVEAIGFLNYLLTGEKDFRRPALDGRDTWETLTLTVLDQCQDAQTFARKLNYFRLIPTFISSIENDGLSDQAIQNALEKTLGFPVTIADLDSVKENVGLSLEDSSEVSGMVRFAGQLRALARRADDSARSEAIIETTQMVAHDIRRPFKLFTSALRFFESKLPKSFFADDALIRALNCLKSSERKVNGLLADLLVADRDLELKFEGYLIEDFLESCVEQADPEHELVIDLDCRLPDLCSAHIDRSKLERAVVNVLENARDHTPRGGTIRVSCHLEAENCLSIEVSSPSHIEPACLPLIFDRFYTNGKPSGTGLGLFITKKIVEAHDGQISCTSTRETGTTFSLRIPLKQKRIKNLVKLNRRTAH